MRQNIKHCANRDALYNVGAASAFDQGDQQMPLTDLDHYIKKPARHVRQSSK